MSGVSKFPSTCNTVSFRFTIIIFSKINFTRWVQIFIFQWKQRTNFSCFPSNCNSEIRVGKLIKLVYRKETKTPTHWSSCIPQWYKRNSITTDLDRAKRIATDFNEEAKIIRNKFIKVDYPKAFINNVIKQFNQDQLHTEVTEEDEPLIPPDFFEFEKPFHLLYCEKNEAKSKDFIKKFHEFTNTNFRIAISWKTRKITSLFSLKDKNLYPSSKIYYGKWKQCGENYVGEAERTCITRWREHDNPTLKSEPARHVNNHIEHEFEWSILCNASIKEHLRKKSWSVIDRNIKTFIRDRTLSM